MTTQKDKHLAARFEICLARYKCGDGDEIERALYGFLSRAPRLHLYKVLRLEAPRPLRPPNELADAAGNESDAFISFMVHIGLPVGSWDTTGPGKRT